MPIKGKNKIYQVILDVIKWDRYFSTVMIFIIFYKYLNNGEFYSISYFKKILKDQFHDL